MCITIAFWSYMYYIILEGENTLCDGKQDGEQTCNQCDEKLSGQGVECMNI